MGSPFEVILGPTDHHNQFYRVRKAVGKVGEKEDALSRIASAINAVYDHETHTMSLSKEDYLLFVMKWS